MLRNSLIVILAAAAIYFAFSANPNLQIIKPANATAFSTNNTNAVTPSISYSNCSDIASGGVGTVQARDKDDGKAKAQLDLSPKGSNNALQCPNNQVVNGVFFTVEDGKEDASSPKNDRVYLWLRCCTMQISGVFR